VGMAILVEKVFVLPGLGDMLIDGLAYRDEPRVLAVVLIAILIVRLCELLTRGSKLLLDPRALAGDA
ncbi:MAG: ABC transporter permease, partial [bacterium]|nr:ABC transporter permease [bacterium]